jgi:hypothetical protein
MEMEPTSQYQFFIRCSFNSSLYLFRGTTSLYLLLTSLPGSSRLRRPSPSGRAVLGRVAPLSNHSARARPSSSFVALRSRRRSPRPRPSCCGSDGGEPLSIRKQHIHVVPPPCMSCEQQIHAAPLSGTSYCEQPLQVAPSGLQHRLRVRSRPPGEDGWCHHGHVVAGYHQRLG